MKASASNPGEFTPSRSVRVRHATCAGGRVFCPRCPRILGIEEGQTDADQTFTLKTVNCLGCCALAPVVQVDDGYMANPSLSNLKKTFKALAQKEDPR